MKKIIVAILAFIYLGTSSGMAMNIHFCMGKFSSVDVFHHSEKSGKCDMKSSTGCCKDDFKVFKIKDSHQLFSNGFKIFSPVLISPINKNFIYDNLFSTKVIATPNNHSPPTANNISLNILFSVFRI